jgi:hypothetical protein
MKTKILSILFIVALVSFSSCELFDPHKPPSISFKTGTDYTSEDVTVAKGTTIKVGVIGNKEEDNMKTYNISYSYDAATTTTTKETFTLSGSEEQHYEKDYDITTRSESGIEKWYFTITDRDGNIAKLSLTLTVN